MHNLCLALALAPLLLFARQTRRDVSDYQLNACNSSLSGQHRRENWELTTLRISIHDILNRNSAF